MSLNEFTIQCKFWGFFSLDIPINFCHVARNGREESLVISQFIDYNFEKCIKTTICAIIQYKLFDIVTNIILENDLKKKFKIFMIFILVLLLHMDVCIFGNGCFTCGRELTLDKVGIYITILQKWDNFIWGRVGSQPMAYGKRFQIYTKKKRQNFI